ncbi:uncharacterized protein LACBIDRAFT_332809 [Laccaria bicolor S238N-H82]|uniref:Predicted protein n=1 Tax=Laccaria bicolor (strain S238N-H82 / ATCC MYA-4686) TaxID=486041 RepID=B0DTS2_LACBS|nr:uncharacterized protein LACBIDRAFT_332809 [Laccaria bicolor S238N-H82]EDR01959.1 predicted protein [Laccaria bicolor S238N-H82]|eukprot:XP_001887350.1 predicted protein [Laccaria bicolor S238N-H82]
MPPRKAAPSEDEDSQGSEAPPLKKHKASAADSEVRVPRKRVASNKQTVLDTNTVNANAKKVQDLEKKLAKARQVAKKTKSFGRQRFSRLSYFGITISIYLSLEAPYVDNFCDQITQLAAVAISSKPTTQLRRSNITQERAALSIPTSHLSNRTFLKVPHKPVSASPEPVDHESLARSSPSRHTSPSSPGYAGDAVAFSDSQSQRSSLPPPSTQRSLPPPSTQVRRKESFPAAELLDGVMSSSRAKASDYNDVVNAILVRTMFDYEGLVSTHDAFPSSDLRRQWALRCWKMASKDADEFYDLSDRMCNLIKRRGSRIRGHVLAVVRPQIIAIYGFSRKVTPQTKARNKQSCEALLENGAFHHKDTGTLTGFSQNKIISEILYLAWFEDKTSQGPLLQHYFNPIPLETLALIFTVIDFCLREWSTGVFIQSKFYEKVVLATHKVYRLELEAWNAINPSVIENIRKKLFNRALRSAGVFDASLKIPSCLQDAIKDRVQMELDGRTATDPKNALLILELHDHGPLTFGAKKQTNLLTLCHNSIRKVVFAIPQVPDGIRFQTSKVHSLANIQPNSERFVNVSMSTTLNQL